MARTTLTQLGFGVPVSNGGYIVDMAAGIGECRMHSNHFVFSQYYGVLRTPLPGITGEASLTIEGATVLNNNGGYPACFIEQSGPYQANIQGSTIQMKGNFIRINQSCVSGEQHQIGIETSFLFIDDVAFYANPDAVQIIGDNTIYLVSSFIKTNNVLFISIPNATSPDTLNFKIGGLTLETTGAPASTCAIGPSPSLSSMIIGSSSCLNGANGFSGFTYTSATPL
jgi:hypothetical protein